ncbi:MAG: caspase family protein, partial [Pseudomonadota bacterium]
MVRICLLVLAAVWLGMGASLAQARVALIIGNSDYRTPGWQLANPANDAALMGEALEEIGFEVHTLLDADETAMETAFRDHGERLAAAGPGTVGVFFYAGHGVQSEGLNYLVPVDLRAQTEADVWAGAPRLDNLFRHLRRAGNETNFIILDACRNNPLLSSSRNVSGGLAAATERDARGMLIAYATEPGAVTEDGAGQANSPYTTALADLIREPGLSAEALFRRVATRVEETTDDRQRPWIESGLRGRKDFCFAGCDLSDDAADWQRLSALNTAASFQAYMGLHPAGAYVAEATAALAELGATATSPALRGEAPPGQTRAIGEGSVAAPTGPVTGIRLLRVLKADDCVDLGGTAINECSVFSAAFNPTRDQVATSSFDGKARLWNPKTGLVETTLTGHRDRVYSVGYSPDGARLVTSAQDGSARVWDVATGSLLTVLTGHTRDVRRAVFSPDGRRIVTASDDGSAWVWDANDGAPLLFLEGHEALVVSAAVSPDGTRIATA